MENDQNEIESFIFETTIRVRAGRFVEKHVHIATAWRRASLVPSEWKAGKYDARRNKYGNNIFYIFQAPLFCTSVFESDMFYLLLSAPMALKIDHGPSHAGVSMEANLYIFIV